jgi:TonB family protein
VILCLLLLWRPPIATAPRCKLEIKTRCLFAFDDVEYPVDALKAKVSGAVTVTGTATRDGRITEVKVVGDDFRTTDGRGVLARAALRNLETWRLEPAQDQQSFRITFSYEINGTVPVGHTDIKFELPTDVVIVGNP